MIKVLEKVHKYVPSKDVEREFVIPNEEGSPSVIKLNNKVFTTMAHLLEETSWQLPESVVLKGYVVTHLRVSNDSMDFCQ